MYNWYESSLTVRYYILPPDRKKTTSLYPEGIANLPKITISKPKGTSKLTPLNKPDNKDTFNITEYKSTNAITSMQLETESGHTSQLNDILEQHDIDALNRLPANIKEKILNKDIDYSKMSKNKIIKQIYENFKSEISDMVPGNNISFRDKDKGNWGVSDLVSLVNVVNKMPSIHRHQLSGIIFVRDDMPDGLEGQENGAKRMPFFTKVALTVEAGEYKMNDTERTITLYDRGSNEHLDLVNQDIRNSIRNIRENSKTEIRSLQIMLNMYRQGKGQSYNIEADGIYGTKTKAAVVDLQMDFARKKIRDKLNIDASVPLSPQLEQILNDIKTGKYTEEQLNSIETLKEIFKPYGIEPDLAIKTLLSNMSQARVDPETFRMFLEELMTAILYEGVTRSEIVLGHEIGHAVQLSGSDFDGKLVSEFAKLSEWTNKDGTPTNTFFMGQHVLEDRVDAFRNVVSNGKIDKGKYLHGRRDNFVNKYAMTDPTDDFAVSYEMLMSDPVYLMNVSPEKFLYLNSLSRVKMGSAKYLLGDPTKDAYYKPNQILDMANKAGISNDRLDTALRNLSGHGDLKFKLLPDTETAILESHKDLLHKIGFTVGAYLDISSPDNKVMSMINSYASMLANIDKQGIEKSINFYNKIIANPAEALGQKNWEKLSPQAKEKLKDKAYISMLYSIGKIGGYVWTLYNAKINERGDKEDYKVADDYLKKNTFKLNMESIKSAYSKVREFGSIVYNPEEVEIQHAMDFFKLLKNDPRKALGDDIWKKLPDNLKIKFKDQAFINSLTGYEGKYVVSYRSIQDALITEWEKDRITKSLLDDMIV